MSLSVTATVSAHPSSRTSACHRVSSQCQLTLQVVHQNVTECHLSVSSPLKSYIRMSLSVTLVTAHLSNGTSACHRVSSSQCQLTPQVVHQNVTECHQCQLTPQVVHQNVTECHQCQLTSQVVHQNVTECHLSVSSPLKSYIRMSPPPAAARVSPHRCCLPRPPNAPTAGVLTHPSRCHIAPMHTTSPLSVHLRFHTPAMQRRPAVTPLSQGGKRGGNNTPPPPLQPLHQSTAPPTAGSVMIDLWGDCSGSVIAASLPSPHPAPPPPSVPTAHLRIFHGPLLTLFPTNDSSLVHTHHVHHIGF